MTMKIRNIAIESELKRSKRLLPYSKKFSPDQPRDDHGRFGEGEGARFLRDINKPRRNPSPAPGQLSDLERRLAAIAAGQSAKPTDNLPATSKTEPWKPEVPRYEPSRDPEIRAAEVVLEKILSDPATARIAAAVAADGGADDVANVTEQLFTPHVNDNWPEEHPLLSELYKGYDKAVTEPGYRVQRYLSDKVTPERVAWEKRWYGKQVNGPQNGIAYANEVLAKLK